ncbi:MAG: hypothetical protein GXY59_12350 [Bacteroidales bacterium]|nr:hypothetical protein [Bacteroidales bacterium]
MAQNDHPFRWEEVDSLVSQGLLQSALDKVNILYAESKRNGREGDALKALVMKLQLEADFQENSLQESVAFLTAEMEEARSPQRQLLASLLAGVYHDYYRNNRWIIDRRTPLATGGGTVKDAAPGDALQEIEGLPFNPETWDRHQFTATINRYTLLSLSDAGVLQSTPVEHYGELLEGDKETRRLRPTLYDLLAFRAIDHFRETAHNDLNERMGYPWDQPGLFAPAHEFIRMPLLTGIKGSSGDETLRAVPFSAGIHALTIFRDLLRFRENGDAAALVDADLHRLEFVFRFSSLIGKQERYIEALREMAHRYQGRPESAEILYRLARQINDRGMLYKPLVSDDHKWDHKEALELAEKAAARFPDTPGGKNCLALAKEIRQPFFNIDGTSEVIPGLPSLLSVQYRNTPVLHFRVVAAEPSPEEMIPLQTPEKRDEYLKRPVLISWSQALPDDGDFQSHRTEVKLPPLIPGYYVVMVSREETFTEKEEVRWFHLWSTRLTLVSRTPGGRSGELLVLDRRSGQPLGGVSIRPFFRKYDTRLRKQIFVPGDQVVTGKDGAATLSYPADQNLNSGYCLLTYKKEKFMTRAFYRGYDGPGQPGKETRVWLFTDRSIYRPGQTIWFKGIAMEKEGEAQQLKNAFPVTVKFNDANGQLIATQEFTTNDYGSFAGSFTAPAGVLTGYMEMVTDYGSVGFRVEEYKRPRFEVTFTPVKGDFQLGETVILKGSALNYAGNGVGDAQVTWRVVRQARYPFPVWGRSWLPRTPEAEIASGTAVTASDGTFSFTFTALPAPDTDPSSQAIFTYTAYADVTDINGETRSGETSVSASLQPLLITTSLGEVVNAATGREVRVTITRPGGEPLPATANYTLTELKAPASALFERRWQQPDRFTMTRGEYAKWFPGEGYGDETDPANWSRGRRVGQGSFESPRDSGFTLPATLAAGTYQLTLTARDTQGKEVSTTQIFRLFRPETGNTPFTDPMTARLLRTEAQPGENLSLLVASPLENAVVFLEAVSKGGLVMKKQLNLDRGQLLVPIPVRESDRGDIVISLVMVRHNRLFTKTLRAAVAYDNKKLELTAGSFRSALDPGAEEEWRITIRDHQGAPAAAELLAGMYDASLDAFAPHQWPFSLYQPFREVIHWQGLGFGLALLRKSSDGHYPPGYTERDYERLPEWSLLGARNLLLKAGTMADGGIRIRGTRTLSMVSQVQAESAGDQVFFSVEEAPAPESAVPGIAAGSAGGGAGIPPPVPPAKPRKDFNETAFFFPQLATNASGDVILRFKMPESLTRWRMMALAHTRDLQTGTLEYTTVTRRELMVFPNAPRFLREGDRLVFPVKISNLSDQPLSGTAEITFFDALTMQPVSHMMGVTQTTRSFYAGKGESALAEWEITVPEGLQAVVYRVTAIAGTFSDGEEAPLPVLTNRMLVTESLPLPLRGRETKTFRFDKLANAGKTGSTLRNYRMTFEYTSNPAWYAVQALPYLMEFPHECSEQVFSRFYANALAGHMAGSDPAIRKVFDAWKSLPADALRAQLEKNEELKAVLLQESPWVREATSESERKQRLAFLFDASRMATEQNASLRKLQELQSVNGGWPWFPGMPESEYITRHILAGLGKLTSRGVITPDEEPLLTEITGKAIVFLDGEMASRFDKLKKEDKEYLKNNHFTQEVVHWFYVRSFFIASRPLPETLTEAVAYYRSQAAAHWKSNSNYMKGMTALFLHRMGERKLALAIMRSLKETALHSDELGMYWRSQPRGWFWYEAPVEAHALLTEAFDEVTGDARAVEELKVWLLKQKQTQDWKTTRATAEAVWALLMRGEPLLTPAQPVSVTAGGLQMNPALATASPTEPGTGYFKKSLDATEITPALARIEVRNPNPGIAWGAAYWQYFENLDKITPAQTPLQVSKQLFKEVNTPQGLQLEAIDGTHPLSVGDKVVVRVILKTDRDMEYVHLKDMRASAFEPVNVLSGYRWQGGLGYYESTLDVATHFFIGYLPKGSYVLEYRLHAAQKGEFSNGITTVQCMYAPEFAAHSEGIRVTVK